MMIRFLLIILFVSFVFYSCTEKTKNTNTQKAIDSIKIKDSLLVALDTLPNIPIVSYKLIKIKSYQALISDYDTLGANIILALNRIDKNRVRSLDSIVVPDTIINNPNIYSPFPQRIDILEKVKKILIVSQTHQAFAIYEFGSLVKWGSTSTGKKSTLTPNGLFATNWKSKKNNKYSK